MDSGANKTPAEVIKEGAFEGTCFRDAYFGVNGKWHRSSWIEFDQLKNIDQIKSIIIQIIMMLMLINMALDVKHH